jgi:hypothetical protein
LSGWWNQGWWGGEDMWLAWGRGEVFRGFCLGGTNGRQLGRTTRRWEDNIKMDLSKVYQGLFPWGQSDRGVKLTTHLHLVPRSKDAWSYTSTPPIRLHGVVFS